MKNLHFSCPVKKLTDKMYLSAFLPLVLHHFHEMHAAHPDKFLIFIMFNCLQILAELSQNPQTIDGEWIFTYLQVFTLEKEVK